MLTLGLFGPLGATELVLILLIVVLLFGARKIPDLARGLGEGIRNFRTGLREEDKNAGKDDSNASQGSDR